MTQSKFSLIFLTHSSRSALILSQSNFSPLVPNLLLSYYLSLNRKLPSSIFSSHLTFFAPFLLYFLLVAPQTSEFQPLSWKDSHLTFCGFLEWYLWTKCSLKLENGLFGNLLHLKLKLDFDNVQNLDNLKKNHFQKRNLVITLTVLSKILDKTLDCESVFNWRVHNFDNLDKQFHSV